jgi:hypothetical protein
MSAETTLFSLPYLSWHPLPSLSPGSQRGADGNCQRLVRVTDGELEAGKGKGGTEWKGMEFLVRPPVEPQAGNTIVPSLDPM